MSAFDLSGSVALVTGGSRGIGLGMARGLAEAGADVMLAARDPERLATAAASLADTGRRIATVSVDLADPAAAQMMVDATVEQLGRLDILVNDAGTNIRRRPEDLELAQWREVMAVNIDGVFAACQAAYPHLRESGRGRIINVGSLMSVFGHPMSAAYSASKGAVVQLTKSLAIAWARDGICANTILPGWIDTDLTRGAREQIEGLDQTVRTRTPAGRWGEPGDLAGIAVFLASEESRFVTGTAIPVDGGFSVAG